MHCAARELSLAPEFTNPQRAGRTLRRSYSENQNEVLLRRSDVVPRAMKAEFPYNLETAANGRVGGRCGVGMRTGESILAANSVNSKAVISMRGKNGSLSESKHAWADLRPLIAFVSNLGNNLANAERAWLN